MGGQEQSSRSAAHAFAAQINTEMKGSHQSDRMLEDELGKLFESEDTSSRIKNSLFPEMAYR